MGDNGWYMGGSDGTGAYDVVFRSSLGRLGVRCLGTGQWRVRVEPAHDAASDTMRTHFKIHGWSLADQVFKRYSVVVKSASKAHLWAALQVAITSLMSVPSSGDVVFNPASVYRVFVTTSGADAGGVPGLDPQTSGSIVPDEAEESPKKKSPGISFAGVGVKAYAHMPEWKEVKAVEVFNDKDPFGSPAAPAAGPEPIVPKTKSTNNTKEVATKKKLTPFEAAFSLAAALKKC